MTILLIVSTPKASKELNKLTVGGVEDVRINTPMNVLRAVECRRYIEYMGTSLRYLNVYADLVETVKTIQRLAPISFIDY